MALLQVPTRNAPQFTLDAQLGAGATTATLNEDVSSIVQAPGVFVVDRIDSSDNLTPDKREYITFTGVSTADLTGLARNADGGGSDQVHAVGAIVEFIPDVLWAQGIHDAFTLEHETTGFHGSLPSLAAANFPGKINPLWYLPALQSGPSVGIGRPLKLPVDGNLDWFAMTLNNPISAASLVIDVNNNGTSIFEAGTRPGILGGGTFVSTASINTKAFSESDELTVDLDNGGNDVDATLQLSGR